MTAVQLPVTGTATATQGIVRVDIQINGELLKSRITPTGRNTVEFSEQVSLRPGTNEIVVTAVDRRNRSVHRRVMVIRIEEPRLPLTEAEPAPAGGGKRVALVIGNGRYPEAPLSNPTNDAQDMAAALRELGFAVTVREDLTKQAMVEAIRAFGKQSQKGDVGLFYFAGHGIQVNGYNYLIPIGAQIEKEQDVEFEAVHIDRVLAEMESAENNLNIVILDACRDNPLPRKFRRITRGLAPVDAPSGTLIAFATAPGKTASDGDGRNGLYTGAWLQYIREPGLRIEDVLYGVQNVVEEKSGGKQIPWYHSSLKRAFYFRR